MSKLIQKLSDIKDIKNIHWRHILQSILVFSCFCTLDTIITDNTIWLISAGTAVAAIVVVMLFAGKIRVGSWSNALNIVSAGLCVGSHFASVLYPIAIFVITLTAGIRIIHARQRMNDYSTLVFIIVSVLAGIVLRFALIYIPVWSLGIIMLATIFNPVLEREEAEIPPKAPLGTQEQTKKPKTAPLIILAAAILAAFFIGIEIFGQPLTAEVEHTFPMQMVNLVYLAGYIIFIVVTLTFRIRITSIILMVLSVFGLIVFLMPPTTIFGIYFLLFLGGGIKVLMLAFPVNLSKNKYKYPGAVSGLLLYRLAFLASGITKTIAGSSWNITSPLTYTLAAVNMAFCTALVFLMFYWLKSELKKEVIIQTVTETVTVIETVEIIKEIPVIRKVLPSDLSEQERKVAELILKGESYREISDKMGILVSTVGTYAARLFTKMGVDGKNQFIAQFTIADTEN